MGDPKALPETLADTELTPSNLDFPVVGMGASAGGIEALVAFFERIPPDAGMAFVVIVHLSPKHASGLRGVIQSATAMNVVEVNEATSISANTVYVIPPTKHLSMNDSYLGVAEIEKGRSRPVAIDLFFRTLALVHRERAVGIVLSGAGSDGAVGIARVKEQGGVTIAQSPADAVFDSMPRAAIATRQIDWVLPVAEMPAKLVQMWVNMRRIELPSAGEGLRTEAPASPQALREAEEALRDVMTLLRARTGHDFKHYKRATVLRRLERRLQINGVANLPAYRAFLHDHAEEAQALLKDLLIGVTNFFRDREAWEAFERIVLPELFADGRSERPPVRVWVPGCATGEEAYTIAMLLAEYADGQAMPPDLQVFASDIDQAAIATARAGAYPASIVADVTPSRLRHFFTKEGNHYRIRKEIRERVLFAIHNVLRDPPFSKLDAISCRNLLIYLDRDVHAQVLEMFHFALRPGGMLFLGSSESADTAAQLFSLVDKKHRIYRASPGGRAGRFVPALPLGALEPMARRAHELPAPRRRGSYAEIHQRLLEQHAPPSVLVDRDGTIVHLSESAGRFLRQPGGLPSNQLATLVAPELRLELRSLMHQALQLNGSVESRRVALERDGRSVQVALTVRPVPGPDDTTLMLVLFHEADDTVARAVHERAAGGHDPAVAYLEEELARSKEQLQHTIEQSETSTEELKASNEELQAINEELRSTTEELETSKEELQSINEELITVNHELKMKVEETGKINDDLQNLIASTDIATVFIDRGMNIKRYTPRATRIFSIIPTDLGRSLLDITHRLDYPSLADDAGEAFSSLRVIEREVSASDGSWYLARVLPYRTVDDRIDGAVLTFVDVTERRNAEQQLRINEERMRRVAESMRDVAIVTLDVGGRIETWNIGAERLFGYGRSEAIGLPVERLFTPEDVERGVPAAELRTAHETGRSEDSRWHQRKDGSRFYCSGVTTALMDGSRLLGYAKIARDLTVSKHAEAQRDEQLRAEAAGRAEAQAAGELKDEFLAVMSHELKNPLNLIQLNAELLARLPEARGSEPIRRATETIRRTVQSQAQIIDDLLDLSRMNTGKLTLYREPVDFAALVERLAAASAGEAERRHIELTADVGPDPVWIFADPVRVEQIVWNLTSNALKFTPAGGRVTLVLRAEADCARLDVEDTGRGIEPAFLPRLFQMFQQAETVKTRRDGGLGIGLALVRHIAELHGGRAEVASEGAGKGARFSVWLPLRDATRELETGGAQRAKLKAGLRALVVDDDVEGADLLRDLLGAEGVAVTVAYSGEQALEAVERLDFDIVACDIAMPGMDGFELAATLRRHPRTAELPIVAVTGFGRIGDVKRALRAGFDAHLAKPITIEKLSALFARALAMRAKA